MLRRCLVLLGLVACAAHRDDAGESADDLTMAVPGVDLTSLDRSVDPCQDFYQFACGGYLSRPLDPEITNPTYVFGRRAFLELQVERDKLFQQVVTESPRSEPQAKAATFYRACSQVTDTDIATAAATLKTKIDGINDPTSLARTVAQLDKLGGGGLLAVYLGTRHGVLEPMVWADRAWADPSDAAAVEQYKQFIEQGIRYALPQASEDEIARIRDNTVSVWTALWVGPNATLPMLDDEPYDAVRLNEALPSFDWDAYLGELGLEYLRGQGATFAPLAALLAQADYPKLRDYLFSSVVGALTQSGGFATDRCANDLGMYMAQAIEPRFLELAGVDDTARAKARELFERVKRSWDAEIDQAAFLDDATRTAAHLKLSHTAAQIALSQSHDDFSDVELPAAYPEMRMLLSQRAFDRKKRQIGEPAPFDFDASPHVVEAWADQELNRFEVPGGMLGGFFFSPHATRFANLSGIGITFGHEIGHEFDDEGRYADAFGDRGQSWWSPDVEQRIVALEDQMVAEYNAWPVPEEPGATIDGKRTLGENMADNGGVKVAYRAAMEVAGRAPSTLGFTPQQQFFLAHAQSYCSNLTPEQFAQMLPTDPHAPPRARINVELANFDKFSEAFSCQPGTPMSPANRVVIW